ncbi:hypothetical protein ACFWG0_26220 [Streptomyces yangpuensis]|uniref:hypothetical protein n=1 Tax=Streptomyces yangpuensis TaxID=1648182 RepID=UPI00366458ED
MESIKTYTGPVTICASCGQPSYTDNQVGHQHFKEQWDGVYCPRFPLAGERIDMDWHEMSLDQVRAEYPDTYPHQSFAVGPRA